MTLSTIPLRTLRYVPAGRLDNSAVDFAGLQVESESAKRLGHLAGLVVDPAAGRLRYLVVETHRWFGKVPRLVPFSTATVDTSQKTLRIDLADTPLELCPEFDPVVLEELTA